MLIRKNLKNSVANNCIKIQRLKVANKVAKRLIDKNQNR